MRILKIFFTAIFALLVIGFFGGLMMREILLVAALGQIKSDIKYLNNLPPEGDLFKRCLEYGGSSFVDDGQPVMKNQLRFISDREYVLESVCQVTSSLRTVIKNKNLPPLVRRVKGQSGYIQGQENHGLEVSIFGRNGIVYDEVGLLASSTHVDVDSSVIVNDGPATVCGGYGYQCCDDVYQVGQEFQQTNALDCPKSCYAGCQEKPVALTFNTDPPANEVTKTIFITSGNYMDFIYTISDVGGDVFSQDKLFGAEADKLTLMDKFFKILDKYAGADQAKQNNYKITLSFGDGTSENINELNGKIPHTYTCPGPSLCVYNAVLQAEAEGGIKSTLGGVAKIQVQVKP